MISFMKKLPEELDKPKAIIVISAHWEEEVPTIIGNNNPSLYYDYYGFPKEAYEIKYPAHGNVEFAKQIKQLFEKNNIQAVIDDKRGLDHGVFIPLLLMYPEADIPVIQISLVKGLRPKEHLSEDKAHRSLWSLGLRHILLSLKQFKLCFTLFKYIPKTITLKKIIAKHRLSSGRYAQYQPVQSGHR